MANKEVWIVFTKCTPLDGCSIDIDGCEFYFVEAYIAVENTATGPSSLHAICNRANEALLDFKLELKDISKCLRYRAEEWISDTELNREVHALALKALSSDSVAFGGFKPEDIEALCRYQHSMEEL